MERVNYTEFEGGFNQIILEESLVLNLKTTMSFVDISINFAINENYPLYTPPEAPPAVIKQEEESEFSVEENEEELEGEADPSEEGVEEDRPQYSYRRGRIFFPNMEQVHWNSRIQPYIDPGTGSVDYGAIDYFYKLEDRYYLAGYWGELDLVSGPPILEIDELKNLPKEKQPQAQQNPKPETETSVS